jgi:tellurite resistance protein TerC
MHLQTVGSPVLWVGFTVLMLSLLALDLGLFHRKDKVVSFREAAGWTITYIILATAFGLGVGAKFGSERALEFYAGYLIELALSVDNLFVFLLLLGSFRVPAPLQHRVLFWGIMGALIMRAVFILLGAALLQRFHFVIYIFGAFLVFTGIKLLIKNDAPSHPEKNAVVRYLGRALRVTPEFRGRHFVVREGGRLWATPLLVVLLAIEATDVVFAVDSIPAIFGVTTDPFIVYTSNIFAVLGLRSMYFVLSNLMGKFRHLPVGLALVLAFIGAKMLLSGVFHVPVLISLAVVAVLLAGSVAWSLLSPLEDGEGGPKGQGPGSEPVVSNDALRTDPVVVGEGSTEKDGDPVGRPLQ